MAKKNIFKKIYDHIETIADEFSDNIPDYSNETLEEREKRQEEYRKKLEEESICPVCGYKNNTFTTFTHTDPFLDRPRTDRFRCYSCYKCGKEWRFKAETKYYNNKILPGGNN